MALRTAQLFTLGVLICALQIGAPPSPVPVPRMVPVVVCATTLPAARTSMPSSMEKVRVKCLSLLLIIYISCGCCTADIDSDMFFSNGNRLSVEGYWGWPLRRLTSGRAANDKLRGDALSRARMIVLVGDAVKKKIHRFRTELTDGNVH